MIREAKEEDLGALLELYLFLHEDIMSGDEHSRMSSSGRNQQGYKLTLSAASFV